MASEIEGCELDVADGELLGSCVTLDIERVKARQEAYWGGELRGR